MERIFAKVALPPLPLEEEVRGIGEEEMAAFVDEDSFPAFDLRLTLAADFIPEAPLDADSGPFCCLGVEAGDLEVRLRRPPSPSEDEMWLYCDVEERILLILMGFDFVIANWFAQKEFGKAAG